MAGWLGSEASVVGEVGDGGGSWGLGTAGSLGEDGSSPKSPCRHRTTKCDTETPVGYVCAGKSTGQLPVLS